ncbi:MAG: bifunctional oligoribonuclease/PAP phosphatase NrnA [Chitinophagales bacterium]|nr:bifunctional oligoribonuclease/PAP phosphatase NrnA [Chitinophagales bacterium]MDW8419162.1 bifunctional oligoribonuclease/PAP phosphatase NrnA [Chitinophagales bacterium]
MAFSEKLITSLNDILRTRRKSVIIIHPQPDADALGASLAWKKFLERRGHEATIISPTEYTKNLNWLPGVDAVLVYENEAIKAKCHELLQNAELIFCLDFNNFSRLEQLGAIVQSAEAAKVLIDHHQQPEPFAQIMFSDTSYCATSEMLYDIIAALHCTDWIDEDLALCLYTGLVTDNGFFQFNNTTPRSMHIAASLLEKGVRPDYVSEKINNIFRENRLRFFGYCLHEKLKLVKDGKVAYMMLSSEEIKRFNLQSGDSEGLVNYPFKIEGVVVSAYFSEETDKIKVSFRSRGAVDVNQFARKHFEGGGHRNAAGGKSYLGLEKTEKKFLDALNDLPLYN